VQAVGGVVDGTGNSPLAGWEDEEKEESRTYRIADAEKAVIIDDALRHGRGLGNSCGRHSNRNLHRSSDSGDGSGRDDGRGDSLGLSRLLGTRHCVEARLKVFL
jgi:hypothetical protein